MLTTDMRDDIDEIIDDLEFGQFPVRSIIDLDFYKLTTGQVIHRFFKGTHVKFQLIVRDHSIPLARFIRERDLREALDYARSLKVRRTDLYLMRGIDLYDRNMFKEDYIDFWRTLELTSYTLKFEGDSIELSFEGPWESVTMWETIALSIVSALYYRGVMHLIPKKEWRGIYQRAMEKLVHKLERIQDNPRITFADFSQRRRHSFLWQKSAIKTAKRMLGKQFTGTSGVYMAFAEDLVPIGTYPHEPIMVMTALADSDDEKRYAQYRFLELWQEVYEKGLRLILPDTYGSAQFFRGAPDWVASWVGQRQDSGLPIDEGERYIRWLLKKQEDPAKRLTVFSDGLDVNPMIEIDRHFGDRHGHPNGWGTLFGNDFVGTYDSPFLRPISMVCKVVEVEGRPAVKLSNNLNKATGPREEIERYIRIFGSEGRGEQEVIV